MANKTYGYAGKTLYVDLSSGKIEKVATDAGMARRFVGGMGYSAKTLYNEVGTDIQPFDSRNLVIFSPGALTGTGAPASSRVEVTTKSPLTGIMGTGNTGGFWGTALKRAGYDAIVVRGESEHPLYLAIDDERVELRDASHLWGRDTWAVTDTLRQEMGESGGHHVSVMAIGIAGENRVRYACPVNDYYHVAGRGHAGGVMGTKKLKAVAVRGTGRVEVADTAKFQKAVRESRNRMLANPAHAGFAKGSALIVGKRYLDWGCLPGKNFQTGVLSGWVENFSKEVVSQYITKPHGACFGCPTPCYNMAEVKDGKYAGLKVSNGTFISPILTFGGNCAIGSLAAIYKCKETCHLLGMDYGTAGATIAFAMELYQRGLISEKDTDDLRLDWGNEEAVLKLLDKIAKREGFGDTLAEGSREAARILGKGTERYSMSIKGLEMLWTDPRSMSKTWAFGYLTSPRGGDNMKSTHCRVDRFESNWTPDKFDMFPEVRKNVYGDPPESRPFAWEGKVEATKWFEDLSSILNAMGVCVFQGNVLLTIGPDSLSRLYSAATGWDVSPHEVMEIGERVFTVLKAYEVREGLTRKHDDWPARFYDEALPEGPAAGATVSRGQTAAKLDDYYRLRGWDAATGLVPHQKLVALGLGDIADDLGKLGKLP